MNSQQNRARESINKKKKKKEKKRKKVNKRKRIRKMCAFRDIFGARERVYRTKVQLKCESAAFTDRDVT